MASAVLAGTIANIDWLSSYFGPSAFLTWHGTYTHSVLVAILISAVSLAIFIVRTFRGGLGIATEVPKSNSVSIDVRSLRILILANVLAAPVCRFAAYRAWMRANPTASRFSGHLAPGDLQRTGSPASTHGFLRFSSPVSRLPELLHLVSSEIGAKSKKPRGQTGAIIGLALVLVYVGARATLHSNVLALMESRTFHGETPRRVSAFPESLSILTWHGVVETESALNEIDVDAVSADTFDPDSSVRLFKPESSPALDAARNTVVAKRFLATAQIPKASMEKMEAWLRRRFAGLALCRGRRDAT